MKKNIPELLRKKLKLEDKIEKIEKEYASLVLEIESKCPCSSEDQVQQNSYSYGGYDHPGENRTWLRCSVCGKTSNLKICYTGFG